MGSGTDGAAIKLDYRLLDTRPNNCQKHGDYIERKTRLLGREDWNGCPQCVGEQVRADQEAERRRWQTERIARIREHRERKAALPEHLGGSTIAGYTIETPSQQRAVEVARRYSDKLRDLLAAGTSLVFLGGVGTGKTHLAVAIARTALQLDLAPRYYEARELIRYWRSAWGQGAIATEAEVADDLRKVDLLIIDEVGANVGSESEVGILGDVISARHRQRRSSIVISNLDEAGLQREIGTRAFDRLKDYNGVLVKFDWQSYRGRRQAPKAEA